MADDVSHKLTSTRAKFELKGRNYIVTGGGQGIGFAVVQAICEMGGNVAALDIRPEPIAAFAKLSSTYGVKTFYTSTDVSSGESLDVGFAKAIDELGSLDGLFCAAGIAISKPFIEQTVDEFMNIQKVNGLENPQLASVGPLTPHRQVFGSFYAAQLATKQFLAQRTPGSIVLTASITAHVGLPGYQMASYNASKGGVLMLSKALAAELAPKGIRVNSISPAFTDTAQTRAAREAAPHVAGLMWSQPPMKRIGEADEITGAVVYLLSDASSYTTGADVLLSGGIHVGRGTDYDML